MARQNSKSSCPLCSRVVEQRSASPFDQVLADGDHSLVVPALGMFVPGYLLVVSKEHVGSFALLGSEALDGVNSMIASAEQLLSPRFGEYIRFEHGQGPDPTMRAGGCIDHAHIHLLPVEHAVTVHLLTSLEWSPFQEFRDLATLDKTSYAYLGVENRHYRTIEVSLPSQWFRHQVGQALAKDTWDWAAYAGSRELTETLTYLQSTELPAPFNSISAKDAFAAT